MPSDPNAAWRVETGRFRAGQPRRAFPLGAQVGVPAGHRVGLEVPWPVPVEYDAGLRFDLLAALVERWVAEHPEEHAPGHEQPGASGWLTRPGVPTLHDQDLAWHAAASAAFDAHRVRLRAFRVVTRTGWLDVVTGERRVWKRLRLSPAAR